MIDSSTIDRIMNALEISEVVGDFVSLKKRGVNLLGLCPFHNEKTPSFTVSPSKGIYKCFGCGKGGNAVNFVMEHEHLTYPDALRFLAKKYHIEVEEKEETAEEKLAKDERESLMVLTSWAQKYFSRILNKEKEGRDVGLSYFRERGFRQEILDQFQLGYSPEERDALSKEAQKSGYKRDFLIKTGLSLERNDQLVDRFAGRVMFPIHGLSGRVIGFGGRTLRTDKKVAKYLNSPESDIYHKSASLYGIYFAKNEIVKQDRCYLVEGYTDVLSFVQSGIHNVVASSGTALTEDQVRMIRRFTRNITIIYDGDEAGVKASLRGIDIILEQGMHVRVLPLPDGEDPDSYARNHGSSEVLKFIADNEQDFISFKARLLSQDAERDPVKKANMITEVVRSVAAIPDRIERSLYLSECARIFGVEENLLFSETARIRRRKWEQTQRREGYERQEAIKPPPRQESPVSQEVFPEEREIIRLMLAHGNEVIAENQPTPKDEVIKITVVDFILQEFDDDPMEFITPLYGSMFAEFRKINGTEVNFETHFIHHPDPDISREAVNMLSPEHQLSKIHKRAGAYIRTEESMLKELIPESVIAFKGRHLKRLIAEIDQEVERLQKLGDMEGVMPLLEQKHALGQYRRQLSKDLKRIIL